MTGQAFRNYVVTTAFKRTDKDTELYYATTDVINKILESYPSADYKQADVDMPLIAGTFAYDLPADFEHMIGDPVIVDGVDSPVLTKMTRPEFQERYSDNKTTSELRQLPKDYCIFGNKLYVGPTPDYAYTLYYDYSASYTGEVTALTPNVPFTNINRLMMKHLVLAVLYKDLDEYDLATFHENEGNKLYHQLIDKEIKNEEMPMSVSYSDL